MWARIDEQMEVDCDSDATNIKEEWVMQIEYVKNGFNTTGFSTLGLCYWCIHNNIRKIQKYKFNIHCAKCRHYCGVYLPYVIY